MIHLIEGKESMTTVLMFFYLGQFVYMHDFNDAAACNNALQAIRALHAGSTPIYTYQATCVPKGTHADTSSHE